MKTRLKLLVAQRRLVKTLVPSVAKSVVEKLEVKKPEVKKQPVTVKKVEVNKTVPKKVVVQNKKPQVIKKK